LLVVTSEFCYVHVRKKEERKAKQKKEEKKVGERQIRN
jgi:hypothetical protein